MIAIRAGGPYLLSLTLGGFNPNQFDVQFAGFTVWQPEAINASTAKNKTVVVRR